MPTIAVVFLISLFIWVSNAMEKGKLERQARPFFQQYNTINSSTYQGAVFLEGFVNGYQGNIGNIIDSAAREYNLSNNVSNNLVTLSDRWQKADRKCRYAGLLSLVTGLALLIGISVKEANKRGWTWQSLLGPQA